jgi:hypothetical protein
MHVQVNRPVSSTAVPGLELNRITKWSSMRVVSGNINVAARALSTWGEETQFFVRCECDNSTPAEQTELLAPNCFVTIYRELRDLAMTNLERGEVP